MSCILVTGGAGFIGSHTCLLLLESGYEVFVIDSFVNSSKNSLERIKTIGKTCNLNFNKKLHIYEGDLRDKKSIIKIFRDAEMFNKKIEGVIHFAGLKAVGESVLNPIKYWECNLYSTINLLAVMENFSCNKIVFSSSATIYGIANSNLSEDTFIDPINPYGKTKASIENFLIDIFNNPKQNWAIANLRYFNPVGAHPSGLIGENPIGIPNNIFPFITQVALGRLRELKIFGNDWPTKDGTCIRDYIHVIDLAEGHIRAMEKLFNNESILLKINLGTGEGTSVLELVKIFENVNKVKIPYSFTRRRKGDYPRVVAKNKLAEKELNWIPKRNIYDMCKDGWNWQIKNPNGYDF